MFQFNQSSLQPFGSPFGQANSSTFPAFPAPPAPSSTTTSSATASATTNNNVASEPKRDGQFYNELKQLNQDLIDYIKQLHEKSPYHDLTPTLEDYIKQFNELEQQYPPRAAVPQQPTAPSTVGVEEEDNDNDEAPPPEPKIDVFEEEGATHSVRCKLYMKAEPGLKLLGLGTLYLKPLGSSPNLQVIMRKAPDYKEVLLNDVVAKNMPVKLISKAVQFVLPAKENATASRMYIAKTRDEKDAEVLHSHLTFST